MQRHRVSRAPQKENRCFAHRFFFALFLYFTMWNDLLCGEIVVARHKSRYLSMEKVIS